jgi:hypothetical protein
MVGPTCYRSSIAMLSLPADSTSKGTPVCTVLTDGTRYQLISVDTMVTNISPLKHAICIFRVRN